MASLSNNSLTLTITMKDGVSKPLKDVEKAVGDVGEKSQTGFGKMGATIGVVSGLVSSLATKAMSMLSNSIGDAVKRVDTLNNFPRILDAMGVGAMDAQKATSALDKGLRGLPTSLNEGAQGVQQFVAAGLSAGKATQTYLAMNDALLAAGGNAQDTGIVMDSLTRALSGGSTQATTIQAALSRMPTALQGLQKETGKSADELYKLYAADPQKLADDLVKLDQRGGGGLSSLQKQAKEATNGIGTGFANMQTAIVRGLGDIIKALGSGDIASSLAGIGTGAENALKGFAGIVAFVKQNKDVFLPLAAGVVAVTLAIWAGNAAMNVYKASVEAWKVATVIWTGVTKAASVAQILFNAAMNASPIMKIVTLVALLVTGLIYFFTQTELGRQIMQAAFQAIGLEIQILVILIQALGNWFVTVWQGISAVWSGVGAWFSARFSEAMTGIRNAFGGIGAFFGGLWGTIKSKFSAVGDMVGQAVSNGFKGALNSVIGWIQDRMNSMINMVNGIIKKIDDVTPGSLGRIPTVSLPHFATGTGYAPGGLSLVGERGPELVNLPRGASVTTAAQTKENLGKSKSGSDVTINGGVHIHNDLDEEKFLRDLGWKMRIA